MKYVVGYMRDGKFVILFQGNNFKIARVMANKFRSQKQEQIEIRRRIMREPDREN